MLCLLVGTGKAVHRDEAPRGSFCEMVDRLRTCSENFGLHSSRFFLRAVIQPVLEPAAENVLTLSSSPFICKNNHKVPTYLHREFLKALGI